MAIPGKVLERRGDEALVDFGGVRRWANVSLVDVDVGGYVIVHAGFAIQTLDEKDAMETLKLWSQVIGGAGDA